MAHLTRCHTCKAPYRCDEPHHPKQSCFDDLGHFCRSCPNVDCRRGDVARDTLARLRASPCPTCGNFGTVMDDDCMNHYCPADCEAAQLMRRDFVSESLPTVGCYLIPD